VYGNADLKGNELFDVFQTKAINEVVPVDYYIHGCPIDRDEFKSVITAIALARNLKSPVSCLCRM